MKTEWSDDIVLLLIHEIENLPVLWDSTDPCSKITSKKNEAWEMLSLQFSKSTEEVKKKWQSLLASYRRERGRERGKSGKKMKSSWYAYEAMGFFGRRYKPRPPIKTEIIDMYDDSSNDNEKEEETQNEDTNLTIVNLKETDPLNTYIEPSRQKRKLSSSQSSAPKMILEDSRANEFSEERESPQPRYNNTRDEYVIFSEYVASKLRKLDSRSCTIAQHYINKILFEAELGRYKDSFLDNNE